MKLLHGHCLELSKQLEDNSINCIVTSPPYNKRGIGGGTFRKIRYETFDDDMEEEEYQKEQIEILNTLYEKVVEGGSFFYNHKVRYANGGSISPWEWLTKTKWHIREEIVWDRNAAVEFSGARFWQVDERIYWLVKGEKHPRLNQKYAKWNSIWRFPLAAGNDHPAPYPLALPLRCIQAVMREPGVVLDPYSGSGTTGVAATLLGHQYIGFDLSEKYLRESEERINMPWKSDIKAFHTYSHKTSDVVGVLDEFFSSPTTG